MCNRKACSFLAAALLAPLFATHGQNRTPTAQEMDRLVQQRTAEVRKTQAAEKAYIEKLNSAVRGTPAGQSGASEQQKLKASISQAGGTLQQSLDRVDCRDKLCALDFRLSQGASGAARVRELFAIDEWVATSQPCAYTMAHDPAGGGGAVRVFIDCGP
ncbi:MAG: hypothetical protein ACRETY_09000 [Steroidobacteraceae bacterium]